MNKKLSNPCALGMHHLCDGVFTGGVCECDCHKKKKEQNQPES